MVACGGCAAGVTMVANALILGLGVWWGSTTTLTISVLPLAGCIAACILGLRGLEVVTALCWSVVWIVGLYVVIQYAVTDNEFGKQLWDPNVGGWWNAVPGTSDIVQWALDILRILPLCVGWLNLCVGGFFAAVALLIYLGIELTDAITSLLCCELGLYRSGENYRELIRKKRLKRKLAKERSKLDETKKRQKNRLLEEKLDKARLKNEYAALKLEEEEEARNEEVIAELPLLVMPQNVVVVGKPVSVCPHDTPPPSPPNANANHEEDADDLDNSLRV